MTRRVRTLAVVSWLGGAASLLPFAEEWFELSGRAANLVLLAVVASAAALGFALYAWSGLDRVLHRLAGPPERPARALVLVAVVASTGAVTVLVATAALGRF